MSRAGEDNWNRKKKQHEDGKKIHEKQKNKEKERRPSTGGLE